MKSKYDWSKAPGDAKAITTDKDGLVRVWQSKQVKIEASHLTQNMEYEIWWLSMELVGKWPSVFTASGSKFDIQPFDGDWADSLEMRPVQDGAA